MPTMNKVDLLDCANGHHNYENGGEHGDPCTVCGHKDTNTYRVNVAMDIRAYGSVEVYGATAEEARKLLTADFIADNFEPHGSGKDDLDYQHPSDIWLDGTCYDTETEEDHPFEPTEIPDGDWINDPLGKAAPAMLAALRRALEDWPQFETDSAPLAPGCIADEAEPVNGGDLVEWFGQWRDAVKDVIAKAEGGAA